MMNSVGSSLQLLYVSQYSVSSYSTVTVGFSEMGGAGRAPLTLVLNQTSAREKDIAIPTRAINAKRPVRDLRIEFDPIEGCGVKTEGSSSERALTYSRVQRKADLSRTSTKKYAVSVKRVVGNMVGYRSSFSNGSFKGDRGERCSE